MRVAWSIKRALVVMKLKSKSDDLVRVQKGGLLLIPISVKLREERMSLGKSREEDKEMLM